MFCKKCGKQIPDDSRFCRYCGTDNAMDNVAEAEEENPNPDLSNKKANRPAANGDKKKRRKPFSVIATGLVIVLAALVAIAFFYYKKMPVYVYYDATWSNNLSSQQVESYKSKAKECYLYQVNDEFVLYNRQTRLIDPLKTMKVFNSSYSSYVYPRDNFADYYYKIGNLNDMFFRAVYVKRPDFFSAIKVIIEIKTGIVWR